MGLVLTPTFTETFVPNANPLNPANWTVFTGGFLSLVASNGVCETPSVGASSANYYSGSALPNNQYASIQIVRLAPDNSGPLVSLYVRASADLSLGNILEVFYTPGQYQAFMSWGASGSTTANLNTVNAGDVFTLAVVGNNYYFLQNNTLIIPVQTDPTGQGSLFTALEVEAFNTLSDCLVTNFVTGSASGSYTEPYSVPDCRTSPNLSTPVNGNLQYTIPSKHSSTLSTDSRSSTPLPCGTYPQNSRTPGTFGPGE